MLVRGTGEGESFLLFWGEGLEYARSPRCYLDGDVWLLASRVLLGFTSARAMLSKLEQLKSKALHAAVSEDHDLLFHVAVAFSKLAPS